MPRQPSGQSTAFVDATTISSTGTPKVSERRATSKDCSGVRSPRTKVGVGSIAADSSVGAAPGEQAATVASIIANNMILNKTLLILTPSSRIDAPSVNNVPNNCIIDACVIVYY